MKLSEITSDKRQQVIQWLSDNAGWQELFAKKSSALSQVLSDIDQMDKSGVINFPNARIMFRDRMHVPAPFKFGEVDCINFFWLDGIELLDLSSLYATSIIGVHLESTKINLNVDEVALLISVAKSPMALLAATSFTNVISGLHMLMSSGKFDVIKIQLYPSSEFNYDKLFTITVNVTESSITILNTADGLTKVSNLLDLQEWLFDNGYEDLL